MNAQQLLRELHRERLDAINKFQKAPTLAELPRRLQIAVQKATAAQRVINRVGQQLARAGYYANTYPKVHRKQEHPRTVYLRKVLAKAKRDADMALMGAASPAERKAALDQFINATKAVK